MRNLMSRHRPYRKAALFVALTYIASWALAGSFFAFEGKWNSTPALVMAIAYMFVPSAMTIVVQRLIYKRDIRKPFGVSLRLNRWFLVAWLLPAGLVFAATGLSLLMPGVEYSPDLAGFFGRLGTIFTPEQVEELKNQARGFPVHPVWIGLLQGLAAGVTVNALAAFGEELGWRGLLQEELSHMGFWRSSALIGLVWGIWHAPLILQGHNYPEHPVAGVAMMTAFCVLASPLLAFVRLRADSVIAAAVLHGTINGTAGLAFLVLKGGSDLTTGLMGAPGLMSLALANLGLWAYGRKHPLTGTESILRGSPSS